jgi:hypothetical protein
LKLNISTTNHKTERKTKMENIFKICKRGIIAILTLCILLGIAGAGLNVTAMAAETTATVEETAVATEEITTVVVEESTISTEEPTVATEENTQELVPMMARGCYDYNTVGDCMSDISSIYGFDYSSNGTGYSCSGNYSVAINNSHNYLNVILSYNGSCIGIYTCSRR